MKLLLNFNKASFRFKMLEINFSYKYFFILCNSCNFIVISIKREREGIYEEKGSFYSNFNEEFSFIIKFLFSMRFQLSKFLQKKQID